MKNNMAVAALTLGLFAVAGGAQTTTTKSNTSHSRTMTTSYSSGGGTSSGSSSSSDQEVKDDLFAGTESFAKAASSATEINMGPDGLGMVNGYNRHGARNMVLNVVRSYSFDKPGQYNMADVEVYRQKVSTGDWHCSVHTRDMKTGESTDVCNKHRTDGLVETAIITVEPKELTFIHTIRKQDDHSDAGGDAMMSFGPMPMMAMVNEGKFVAMAAKMQADSAVMQARMGVMADGSNVYFGSDTEHKIVTLKHKPGTTPKQFFMMDIPDAKPAEPGPASGDLKLEMKRDSPAEKPKSSFMIVVPDDVPAPPAAAPSEPAAPPAPAEPAPAAPQQ